MNKNFRINKIETEYELKEFNRSIQNSYFEELSSNIQHSDSLNRILITNNARETIFEHISWSIDSERNSVEQGGILIGHSYLEKDTNQITGLVTQAIPATTAKGSMAYLEFDHNTWKLMIDKLDLINDDNQEDELQVIGWYHTHPGRLSVFMSGTDLNTQSKMFPMDWQFAIVLNPQKQIWRTFSGSKAKECKGYMLK